MHITIWAVCLAPVSCNKDTCGESAIAFRNKTADTVWIKVHEATNGYRQVNPGKSTIFFHLKPNFRYDYSVNDGEGMIAIGNQTTEACKALTINIDP